MRERGRDAEVFVVVGELEHQGPPSGIPNRAFALPARELGGYTWTVLGRIRYRLGALLFLYRHVLDDPFVLPDRER